MTARTTRRIAGRGAYRAVWRAVQRSLARADFRVVAFVVRARKLELVVEADNALALARGMQGLQVAAARRLNQAAGTAGCVFADRYRPRALITRAAVRAALSGLADARSPSAQSRGPRSGLLMRAVRVAWPATYLLRIELLRRASLGLSSGPAP